MPALASLSQEDLDALAEEQAAQDAAAAAPVPAPDQAPAPAPEAAAPAPVPPPYDPAQDTQGMQAQPAPITVAPPAADPTTDPQASYQQGVYTQQIAQPGPEYTTQTIAPAPVAAAPVPPPDQSAPLGPLTGTMWDPSVPANGFTTEDITSSTPYTTVASALHGDTPKPRPGSFDAGMIWGPNVFEPVMAPDGVGGGGAPLIPEPVRLAPGEYRPGFNAQGGVVSRAGVPKLQGPGLRPGGGLSSIHPDYVRPGTVAAEVPPPPAVAPPRIYPEDMPLSEIPLEDYISPEPATSRAGHREWIGDLLNESEIQQLQQSQVPPPPDAALNGPRNMTEASKGISPDVTVQPPQPAPNMTDAAKAFSPELTGYRTPTPSEARPAASRPTLRVGQEPVPVPDQGPVADPAYVRKSTGRPSLGNGEVIPPPKPTGKFGRPIDDVPVSRADTPPPRTVATEPVPEPATDRPVPEPAPTGEGQATTPTAAKPGIATRVVKGVGKSLIQHPVRTAAGVAAGVFSANEALHRRGLAGAPAGTTPPSGTTRDQTTTQTLDPMEQARRSGVPSSAKRGTLASMPGVDVVGEGKEVWGAIDEHGNFVLFPDGMTPDAMKARMQQIADAGGSPVPTPAAAPPSPPASSGPAASPPASPSPPVNTPIAPLATGTAAAEDAQPSSGTPLITKDGVDTGLVLNNDGTVTQKSGGSSKGYYDSNGDWRWYNDYSRSSSGSSSHKTYGSSGSSRSSSKKKKGSSSSQFGDGFPFNRPNSPMRDFILKAIQESMAGSHSKKR
jgi:hypothetical protein